MGQAATQQHKASDQRHPDLEVTHPGYIIRTMYIEPLEISTRDFAKKLDLHERTVSRLLNGKSSLTIETALKLSRLFKTSPEFWMNMQVKYDLWHKSREMDLDKYKPLEW